MAVWGCSPSPATQAPVSISINVDHKIIQLDASTGSTVREALQSARVTLGELDKVDPKLSTILSEDKVIKIVRVKEELYTEQVILPFEHQELKNEALPEGDRRLSQAGLNGMEEITHRRVYEDDVEVSNTIVKTTVIKEAVPEIEMVGTRSLFAPIALPGKLAYISAGNAWIIENNTSDRQLVVSTGDLDGRIFSLSRDGKFLLFTRFSKTEKTINTLWVASLETDPVRIIDLQVENIVHFAEFNPTSNIVAYSTVDWSEAPPGWQANNDLFEIGVSPDGTVDTPRLELQPTTGGVYGWWGTVYAWSPDQSLFLLSRPDGVGVIHNNDHTQTSLLKIDPYQTGENWAWLPGAAWSPDGNVVYAVTYTTSVAMNSNAVSEFDLTAIPLLGGSPVSLVKDVGMFAYPVPSPITQSNLVVDPVSGETIEQAHFSIAYLQAITPDQSETSAYRLFMVERDGSAQKALFPQESAAGLEPQHVAWSPVSIDDGGNYAIVLVYNGNIWMIDTGTGIARQVTGDGLTTRLDWR